MIIEDYSLVGFDNANTDEPTEGKFIHITGPDDEYLVFAPYALAKWHAQILIEFCRRHEDASCTALQSGEDGRFDVPDWHVEGGGHYRLNRASRKLELGGSSKAFGQYNKSTLPRKIYGVKGWDDFEVVIR